MFSKYFSWKSVKLCKYFFSWIYWIFANHALPVVAGNKSGGIAIFLTARNGNLNNNKYSNHQDSSSVVRIYNKYDQETKLLDLDTFKISNCIFERNSNSKSCLYYTGASNCASFELN